MLCWNNEIQADLSCLRQDISNAMRAPHNFREDANEVSCQTGPAIFYNFICLNMFTYVPCHTYVPCLAPHVAFLGTVISDLKYLFGI